MKLIVAYEAIDASLFPGALRQPAWIKLKQGIRAKDLSVAVQGALGPLANKVGESKKVRAVELSFDKAISYRLVNQQLLGIGLDMLGLNESWLLNNYKPSLELRVGPLYGRLPQLKNRYGFSWEELDGFLRKHFLPVFCASLSVLDSKPTEANIKRIAVGRLLEAYHAFTLESLNVREDVARNSTYRSLIFTQAMRGDVDAIKELRKSLYLFLKVNEVVGQDEMAVHPHEKDKPIKALDNNFSLYFDSPDENIIYLNLLKSTVYPLLNKAVENSYRPRRISSEDLVVNVLKELRKVLRLKLYGGAFCFDESMRVAVTREVDNVFSAGASSSNKRRLSLGRSCKEQVASMKESPYKGEC